MDDWTPDPLVAPLSAFEEAENEKRPVVVGYVTEASSAIDVSRNSNRAPGQPGPNQSYRMGER